jgi:hypothetical protein
MEYEQILSAKLEDYDGPIFTDNMNKLNDISSYVYLYYKSSHTKVIDGLRNDANVVWDIKTSDRYKWFFGIEKKFNDDIFKREFILLIPCSSLSSRFSTVDRSCAFYTKGDFSEEYLKDTVETVVSNLKKLVY